jgi:hypothetical protein
MLSYEKLATDKPGTSLPLSYQRTSECRNPVIKCWWVRNGTDRYGLATKLGKNKTIDTDPRISRI